MENQSFAGGIFKGEVKNGLHHPFNSFAKTELNDPYLISSTAGKCRLPACLGRGNEVDE